MATVATRPTAGSEVDLCFQQTKQEVESLDLADVMDAAARKCGWTDEEKLLAERDYRLFLRLNQSLPGACIIPSEMIDDVWHCHILFTRQYADDCQHVFGYFLHHRPYVAGQMADHASIQREIEGTKEMFHHSYGSVPESYHRIPKMICAGGCASEPDR